MLFRSGLRPRARSGCSLRPGSLLRLILIFYQLPQNLHQNQLTLTRNRLLLIHSQDINNTKSELVKVDRTLTIEGDLTIPLNVGDVLSQR